MPTVAYPLKSLAYLMANLEYLASMKPDALATLPRLITDHAPPGIAAKAANAAIAVLMGPREVIATPPEPPSDMLRAVRVSVDTLLRHNARSLTSLALARLVSREMGQRGLALGSETIRRNYLPQLREGKHPAFHSVAGKGLWRQPT